MKLFFITGNKGKFDEASKIIPELEQKDIDLVEIQSLDPKEIIAAKLIEARNKVSESLVVEDAGIYLNCLNGFPGPLGKWMMKAIDNIGLFNIVKNFDDHGAEVKVILGFITEDNEIKYFEGSISGKIVEPRGTNGFGFDPIFIPDGYDKTFAEMTLEEKNEISMRKIAFQKLKDYLKSNNK